MEGINGQRNELARRQRKMLLIAPLVVVPLLALCFHGLGGGRGIKRLSSASTGRGLNMTLPDAHLDQKKKALNKLGLYDKAAADSVRLSERRRNDPYFPGNASARVPGMAGRPDSGGWRMTPGLHQGGLVGLRPGEAHPDEQSQELLGKLDLLKGMLGRQSEERNRLGLQVQEGMPGMRGGGMESATNNRMYGSVPGVPLGSSGNVAVGPTGELLPPGSSRGDPDLDKLSGMLDKILRIQHPEAERAGDTVAPVAGSRGIGRLSPVEKTEVIDTMKADSLDAIADARGKRDADLSAGFSDVDDQAGSDAATENMVEAVVAHDQTLISGESLTFRLTQEAVLNGVRISAGTMFSGKASLSGERLLVSVNAIRVGNSSVPVSLEVLDQDGVAGILERGSINRDVAKEASDESMGTLAATPIDASPAGQAAAAAGMQAARTLFSRKVRMVRVSVKAGYRVLLRNKKM